MSRILQRLRKLETQLTDHSGYAPHSEAWFRYWAERHDRFMATGDGEWLKGITLAWHDEMLRRAEEQTVRMGRHLLAIRFNPPPQPGDIIEFTRTLKSQHYNPLVTADLTPGSAPAIMIGNRAYPLRDVWS
jgi:hypothetical protein